jgi:site-specific DNA-methyltransferase (adenine-specific)
MTLLLPERSVTTLDTVHCMDALTLLRAMPDGYVDIVVTSPPYNINHKSGQGKHSIFEANSWRRRFEDGYVTYKDDMPESLYQAWMRSVVRECLRISKGLVWINHKMRFRDGIGIHPLSFLPFPIWSEIIWNRNGSMMLNSRRFALSHEYIYGFGKPHFWNNDFNGLLSVWQIHRVTNNEHPCPYPLQLVSYLIEASCPYGGIILDPFMGSGTTAVAARNLDRHYIGCDISAEYVNLARQRIQNSDPYQASILPTGETQLSLFEVNT